MNAQHLDYLPLFVDLRERRAVVIGGGRVAARKAELLLRAQAEVTVIAPELAPSLRQLLTGAGGRRLVHLAAPFEAGQLDGAALVVAATDSDEVNRAVATSARERGIMVNVVDDPRHSSCVMPAIVDRSPVVVAIGTSGCAPVLARQVRAQIEALLPGRLGELARLAGQLRRRVRSRLAASQRRSFWERVLGGLFGTQVLAGRADMALSTFTAELETACATPAQARGEVYLIGAGPGDADLLTLRALQVLQCADVVLYDRLVSPEVLERARRDAQLVYVGKERGGRAMTQAEIERLILRHARAGRRVARLKGGDPFVFGRGGEELQTLAAHGIPCTVIPGITAALGAAASAGIPLTHRQLAGSVTFVTGHSAGGEEPDWSALARPGQTVVFYMGVAQLAHITGRLRAAGAPASRPVALIERATLPGERQLHGTLADIGPRANDAAITPPALLIVGDVAALAASAIPPSRSLDVRLRSVA